MSDAKEISNLTSIEKTALTLLGMGEDAASNVLKYFEREDIEKVTNAMSRLKGVKSDDANIVLVDFFERYREHSGIKGASKNFLQSTLEKTLGAEGAKGVLSGIFGDELKEKMHEIEYYDPEQVAAFLKPEHPQMIAIFLSFLEHEPSAKIINQLDPSIADDVIYRIATLKNIDADVAGDLRELIDRCIEHFSNNESASVDGVKQAAEILNVFKGDTSRLLKMIKGQNKDLASKIEETRFGFSLLVRQPEKTMDKIVQEVPLSDWAICLKGAERDLLDKVYGSMPNRMRQSLEDQMNAIGAQPTGKVEGVRGRVMDQLREVADAGEIELQLSAEEVVK